MVAINILKKLEKSVKADTLKDQMIRQTIISTQEDVTEIKEDIKRIEVKIDQLN